MIKPRKVTEYLKYTFSEEVRIDTGEVVKTERMTGEELQMDLPIV